MFAAGAECFFECVFVEVFCNGCVLDDADEECAEEGCGDSEVVGGGE